MDNGKALMQVQDLYAGYREHDILHGVNLHIQSGEIICLLGPNGAGKSTVFKAVYGLIKVRSGHIRFDGQDITNQRPQDMLRSGIAIVPQMRSLFPQMTVYENLELGLYLEKDRRRIKRRVDDVLSIFPRLGERARQNAGTLSGGEQRMVEIGRALVWEPRVLLIDEPSAGLAPILSHTIFRDLYRLNREIGLTVFMIEQNARQGLQISHRGYVLRMGKNIYEGTARGLLENPKVQQAFLGVHAGTAPPAFRLNLSWE